MPDAAGVTAGERRRKQARERQALTLVATARETVFDPPRLATCTIAA